VVTNESQKFFVLGQMEELGLDFPKDNLLIEPQGRNTLPAIIFGMHEIEKQFGSCVAGVFSSDHIMDIEAMDTIAGAEKLAHDYLVTFGIVPKSPHTGYGYINPGDVVGAGYKVSEFKEKPGLDEAREYVDEGYLWNSGMFLLDTDVFLSEVAEHAPDLGNAFRSGRDINEIYNEIPSVSIDYGILEKSDRVAVVGLDVKWSDLGNFDAMYQEFDKDRIGNVVFGCDDASVESTGNIIQSTENKVVSLIGVDNMVVVDTPDALLVCPRDRCQDVKDVVGALKEQDDERVSLHRTVYRPWGSYTILEDLERYKIKRIQVLPEKTLSLQLHYHRSEHWVVVTGTACVQVDSERFYLRHGESTFIRPGIKHRLSNPGKFVLEIIEVQLGEYVGEDDIVRFDDEYGRE